MVTTNARATLADLDGMPDDGRRYELGWLTTGWPSPLPLRLRFWLWVWTAATNCLARRRVRSVLVVDKPFPVEIVPADLVRHQPVDAALEAHLDLPAAVRIALSQQA